MRLLVAGAQAPLEGEIVIPPSKYHAHRALMLAALAPGTSMIADRTEARHVQFTVQALRDLGVEIGVEWPALEGDGGDRVHAAQRRGLSRQLRHDPLLPAGPGGTR